MVAAKEVIRATESGDVDSLKEILEEDKELQTAARWITLVDKKRRNPLHLASLHGHILAVRFIIHELCKAEKDPELQKEYINLLDKKGRSALFHAAARGRSKVVRYLMEIGADMNTATNENHSAAGSTAIMACAEQGHVECFTYMMDHGADCLAQRKDAADALYLAARNGNYEIVKKIATTDQIKIICHEVIDKTTFRGRTALCAAAFHGHLTIAKLLFEHGANVNHQDHDSFTPLLLASYGGHLKFVKWLLRNGADPTAVDKFGSTALESSEISGHIEVTNFLKNWEDLECRETLRKDSTVIMQKKIKKVLRKSKKKLLAFYS